MKLSLIVAMDRNGLIGKDGGLPWPRIPEDMRHFRATTKAKPIIVGRKTAGAIPSLSSRPMYVVSESKRLGPSTVYDLDGCAADVTVVRSPIHALARIAVEWCRWPICCGGATLYRAYQGLFTEAHVTLIDGEFEGDTYFPFPLLGSPEWTPLAEPETLAPGVVHHHLGRVGR